MDLCNNAVKKTVRLLMLLMLLMSQMPNASTTLCDRFTLVNRNSRLVFYGLDLDGFPNLMNVNFQAVARAGNRQREKRCRMNEIPFSTFNLIFKASYKFIRKERFRL